MDDMKDKVKGFMKKVNNPFTPSSSGRFKGQGRVLGSSPGLANPIHAQSSISVNSGSNWKAPTNSSKPAGETTFNAPRPVSNTSDYHKINDPSRALSTPKTVLPSNNSSENQGISNPNSAHTDGFDPFDSTVTSGKRNKNGYSFNVVECPVCNQAFDSEEEVSVHIESCVTNCGDDVDDVAVEDKVELRNKSEACASAYLTGKPSEGSIAIVLKLLKNITREPENAKFRRIRMSNPKIREAVGEATGGIELLECVGFKLQEEGGEMWAIMNVPLEEDLPTLKKLISLLEPKKTEDFSASAAAGFNGKLEQEDSNLESNEQSEPKVIDRQIRVFFSASEKVAAKIELPESFYNLSAEELRREAEARKKKLADSKLLIPKSYKERQAKAARRTYKKTIIRVQFPDGVVLQAAFSPWEPTSILYEFVSSALKQPGLEFELVHPIPVKRRVIPCFPATGERATRLEDEDLVPTALIKFKPKETDSMVFTGLRNELLEISEPLLSIS